MQKAAKGLSEMTLGTVQLGLNYGIANRFGKPDRETAFGILLKAAGLGINSLDTARSYGDSEEVIGEFFRRHPRHAAEMMVTSKISADTPAPSSDADVERELAGKAEASLEALGVGKLRCLLLHRAKDMYRSGVDRAMEGIVKRGLAEEVGVSVYTGEEIREMLKHPAYTAVQLPVSVLDQRLLNTGLFEELRRRGCTVFARSVFCQGLVFLSPDDLSRPALREHAAGPLRLFRQRCEAVGCSPGEYALAFVRHLHAADSIVLGVDTLEEEDLDAALFELPEMGGEEFERARALFAGVPFERIMEALR